MRLLAIKITLTLSFSDENMVVFDARSRELRKQLKAELTAEIASPSGPFGRTLRGVYPNRKMKP